MSGEFSLTAEPPKRLTGHQERELLQRAFARRQTPALGLKLAQLHNRLDEFPETFSLLDRDEDPRDFASAMALMAALQGLGSPADLDRALAIAVAAERLAENDRFRAEAIEAQAGLLLRGGVSDRAEAALEKALALDPANFDSFRRLTGLWLADNAPDRVIALADALEARGVSHIQLLGTRTLALAQRGDFRKAQELAGVQRFLFQSVPAVPAEWTDQDSFLSALAKELLDSPGLRNGRHGTASVNSLRIDEPATAATPAMRALQRTIVRHVEHAINALPSGDHPWLRIRPNSAQLRMWCVITGAEGRERWHMHPQGWASGGFYVEVPEAVQSGTGQAGCLEFGLPDFLIGADAAAAFGATLLRPQPGLLTLFPSHAFHRTHPHGAVGRRVCVAFDLVSA
jgi:Putative 2OG-Fe(II) oxygenase